MSIDIHVEMGLYFEVAEGVETPHYRSGQRCSHSGCQRHHAPMASSQDVFCSQCGSPMEETHWQDGYCTPNASDFCEAVFEDENFLESELQGLNGRIWLYNYQLESIPDSAEALSDMIELGGGALDLSTLCSPKIIADALKEDPRLARVVPEFYRYFDLPDGQPGLLTLKFGFISYCA